MREMSGLAESDREKPPLKCCDRCLQTAWRLSKFPVGVVRPLNSATPDGFLLDLLDEALSNTFKDRFVRVETCEECESCRHERKWTGRDPCDEPGLSRGVEDIQEINGRGKLCFIRLFSHPLGYDAVSEHGNYLSFLDNRVANWLADQDE